MGGRAPIRTTLADPAADRVRRNHDERLTRLEDSPLGGAKLLVDVQLLDGVITPVAHGLGRPCAAFVSPVRRISGTGLGGAPRIQRIDGSVSEASATVHADPSTHVTLFAADFDAVGVVVDVLVVPL